MIVEVTTSTLTSMSTPASMSKQVARSLNASGHQWRPRGGQRLLEALAGFTRQALHAQELAFIHPESGERLTFSAPIPGDLAELLQCLGDEDPA